MKAIRRNTYKFTLSMLLATLCLLFLESCSANGSYTSYGGGSAQFWAPRRPKKIDFTRPVGRPRRK